MTSTPALRTRWAAIGAAVAVTLGAVGVGSMNVASAEISSGDRPVYVPINGCRLIDTRSEPQFNVGDKDTPLAADQTLTIAAVGDNGQCIDEDAIPTDAVALTLNVTPVNATEETFLTVWAEGDDPGTSSLNPSPGQPLSPNAVNTPLTEGGTFNLRNNVGTVDVVIDITGYYADHNHDDRYYTQSEVDALIADASGGTYTISARISSAGDVELAQGLPAGATIDAERQATGTYSFTVDGIESLGAPFLFPTVVANAISSSGQACTHGGGGSLSGDPLTSFGTFVFCTNTSGNPTNSSINVMIHLQRS